jgi:non-ribosomal peptide synthase protein (TIGR01720 family)
LRLRFTGRAEGSWRQRQEQGESAVPFESHDLSGLADEERTRAVDALVAERQQSLDLAEGPSARAVHLKLSPAEPDRLLLLPHHLVTDGVSRALLLEDLGTLLAGGTLPPKTTAYLTWSHRLEELARDGSCRDELGFWLEQGAGENRPVPVDAPGRPRLGAITAQEVILTVEQTAAVRRRAQSWRVTMSELLVWIAGRMLADWTGRPDHLIGTTGDGRGVILPDLDVSRTVGWFQVLYPIRLTLPEGGGDAETATAIARRLRSVPRGGVGYGVLRYADPQTRAQLAALPAPEVTVNYMGAFGFDEVPTGAAAFDICHGPLGSEQDPDAPWPFLLDVVGTVVADRLRVELVFDPAIHRPSTVQRLAGLVHHTLLRLASGD